MKKRLRSAAALVLTVMLTSLLCLALYHYNNKITKTSEQAFQGVLKIEEEDLRAPLYLIKGWKFYPGQLLQPENLQKNSPELYMLYTGIGDYTGLGSYNDPEAVHGSGTYVMHLLVPEKKTSYALELPEIFSSYRLYINDFLVLQMGEPDPENYRSTTQNRMVFFEASERITIMIAVSDFSHFYSGIVYPPAFGLPQRLENVRNIRYGLAAVMVTTGLLIAVASLYIGLRMKAKNAIIFFMLCLSMCGFSSYPIYHTLFALPVFPVYGLELLSGYLVSFFVVLLYNQICGVHPWVNKISCGITGGFCILAFAYGMCSSRLTASVIQFFSGFVFLFKVMVFCYLVVMSWLLLNKKSQSAASLFYASAAYGCFFIWDRILPDYEPVYGGWFAEWGSLFLVIAIGYILWRNLVSAYSYGLIFAEEQRSMVRMLSMQSSYMKKLTNQISENRKAVHDFRQHLHTISKLVQQIKTDTSQEGLYRKLTEYLDSLSGMKAAPLLFANRTFCGNVTVDALLQYYYEIAVQRGIRVDFHLLLPENIGFSDVELCIVFGNLIENAIHGCCQDQEDRFITLASRETNSQLFICIENSYNGKYRRSGKFFLSVGSKKERQGIGLESVQEIIELHGGTVNIYPLEHIFRVGMILPL